MGFFMRVIQPVTLGMTITIVHVYHNATTFTYLHGKLIHTMNNNMNYYKK